MNSFSSIRSNLLVVLTLCVLFAGALSNPAGGSAHSGNVNTSRAFKDLVLPPNSSTNLTKSIIDSTLSILGVLAFTIAFVIIPVFALLYTSGSWGAAGRTSRSLKNHGEQSNKNSHVRLARSILDSDRCIERIVCEVSRGARNSRADKWADMIFNNVPTEGKFMRRVSDVYRARQLDCNNYTCEPVGFVVRLFIYATDWNTVLKG